MSQLVTNGIATSLLVALIAIVAFAATNLENLFILLSYFQHPQYSVRATSTGYVCAVGSSLVASYGLSQVAHFAPHASIRYLGFLPLFLAAWEALKLFRRPTDRPKVESNLQQIRELRGAAIVGLVTLVSSGDLLVVFASLFADTRFSSDLTLLLTAIGMGFIWVLLAQWLLTHPWVSQWLERFQYVLLPVLLATIGLFILLDTPADLE